MTLEMWQNCCSYTNFSHVHELLMDYFEDAIKIFGNFK